MSKVKKKYCKDENGEIFSPITSIDSVIDKDGKSLTEIHNNMIINQKYHNYNTEEHIIGRWIDGKPLYEKTLKIDLNVKVDQRVYSINYSDYEVEDIDTSFIDRGSSFICNTNNDQRWGLDQIIYTGDGTLELYLNTYPTKMGIVFYILYYGTVTLPCTVTLKYTKTTDTASTPIEDNIASTYPQLLNLIYPIGSIYTSVNNVSPEILFGGKWERFSRGRTLIGVDETDTDFDQALITGGEKTHILTEDELPKISGSAQVSNSLVSQGAYSDFISSAWGNMSATQGNTTENYTSGSGLTSRSAKMKRTITFKFGNDQPHNNMPPYITVFIWKRIS